MHRCKAHLDLQEGVSDAADVMLRREAAHQQAAQHLAQRGHVTPVSFNSSWLHRADFQHECDSCEEHAVVPVCQQLSRCVLEGLH